MAPKTRGASVGAAGMKRKRTARKPIREPTPSSDSSTPAASPARPTPEVDLFAARTITTGRKVNFELLENEGFHLGRQIIEMGLEKVCSLDCPTYPALVKEFYKNLARGDDGLISSVRNVNLRITSVILSRLLDLPLSGPSSYTPEDRSPALTRLLNRNIDDIEEVHANQLPLELRLLHNICSRILFPKTGRFDYVSERDVFVMDCIVSGKPFNLPRMIIWYIADCGSKRKSSLPYGMILTQIFRTQGVVINDSELKKELRHTDYYSLATIQRMGFIKTGGRWVRRGQDEERAADAPGPSVRLPTPESPEHIISDQIPSSDPAPPAPASTSASASVGFNEVQLNQLRSLFSELDNQRKEEINQLKDEIKGIKEAFDSRLDLFSLSFMDSAGLLSSKLNEILGKLDGIVDKSAAYTNASSSLRRDIDAAVDQIQSHFEDFKKFQKEDFMEMIGHLKQIVFKHT